MKRLFLASNIGNVAKDIARFFLPEKRKILFIKTASEVEKDEPAWLTADRSSLLAAGFEISDYSITGKTADDLATQIDRQDIILVSGGNTYYLLEKIQLTGVSDVIRRAVEKGVPYIGSSAGSVVAGPDIRPVGKLDDISKAPKIRSFQGLGLVDFVIIPHWGSDGEHADTAVENIRDNYTDDFKFILLTDNQYVLVEGDMYKIEDVNRR
jgi:dipeptidase E